MQNTNYIYDVLNEQKAFRNELLAKSEALFSHKDAVPLMKVKDVEAKYLINEASSLCYVLIKNQYGNVDVFVEELVKGREESALDYLKSYISRRTVSGEGVSLNLVVKKTNQKNREDMKTELESFIDIAKGIPSVTAEYLASLERELADFDSTEIDREEAWPSPNLWLIKDYVDFIRGYVDMSDYPDAFYYALGKAGTDAYQPKVDGLIKREHLMRIVCEKLCFDDVNRFEFNDGDNHIWLKDGDLIIEDQNCAFVFESKEKGNISIFFINTESRGREASWKAFEEKRANNALTLSDRVLVIEDNKAVYADSGTIMYVFSLVNEAAVKAVVKHIEKHQRQTTE